MFRVIFLMLPLCLCVVAENIKPPLVTFPKKATTHYVSGTEKTLSCKADGYPSPSYTWFKILDMAKGNMQAVSPVAGVIEMDASIGTLQFKKFYANSNGKYICQATNMFHVSGQRKTASSFSPVVTVLKEELPKFKVTGTPSSFKGKEYTYMKLACSGKGNAVGEKVQNFWYLVFPTKDQSNEQLKDKDGRFYVDIEGNLHIAYLLREDSTNSIGGKYTCAIGVADVIRLGSNLDLEVEQDDNPVAVKPKLVHKTKAGTKVELYRTAVLECIFDGYDPNYPHLPKITWKDSSFNEIKTDVKKYVISSNGRRLEIKHVQETDEGDYYCQGSNSGGSSEQEDVHLDVISSPIWIVDDKVDPPYYGSPSDQTRPEGSNVVFNCDARSAVGEKAPNQPIWFINGNKYGRHTSEYEYSMSDDYKHLTLLDVKKTDTKCVQCIVSNDVGQTLEDGCLTVILKIAITQRPEEKQKISKGDVVQLTVRATTDPSVTNLQYQWIFRNKTYPNNTTKEATPDFVTYDPQTLEAYINTSKLTNEEFRKIGGLYQRRVYHSNDEVVVDVEVIIEGEVAPIVQSAGFDMWIIGLIIGILFLIIVIIIIIFIICRKQQEGDYNVDKKETGAGLDPEKELKSQGFDDYSRPDYSDYDYADRKPRGDLEYDDVPIGGDDESLGEYGDEEATYFNEDGSFIGIYQSHEAPPKPQYSAESTI